MSDEIKPALTAEEWAEGEVEVGTCGVLYADGTVVLDDCAHTTLSGILPRHRAAALCLHGQPFGFMREDVVRHREEARWEREVAEEDPTNPCAKGLEAADWHDSMADRIEALLPPEES